MEESDLFGEAEEEEEEEEEVEWPSSAKIEGKVLDRDEVSKLQTEVIDKAAGLLFVSPEDASGMLRYFKWSFQLLSEAWFENEDQVRQDTGYVAKKVVSVLGPVINCGICFEEYPLDGASCALCCEHWFCKECWEGYLSNATGPQCIRIRCPQPKCSAAIPDRTVLSLLPPDLGKKFSEFVLRSFVESCVDLKWCPARNCRYAIRAPSETQEVTCKCMASFCWGCGSDLHPSVSCELATKWIAKNKSEKENEAWVAGCTKPCPKCKKPIEKSSGCNHMTCRCGHEFCWLCFENWKSHKGCNYNPNEPGAKDRRQARVESKRLEHFFAGFHKQDESLKHAQEVLSTISEHLDEMSGVWNIQRNEIEYIADAWTEIVRCRRVLKWSFVSGYFLCCDDAAGNDSRILFFYHLQKKAADLIDKLQVCVQEERMTAMFENFTGYQYKLTTLTKQTKHFIESLAVSFEDELGEVDVDASKENAKKRKIQKPQVVSAASAEPVAPYGWRPNEDEDAYIAGNRGWRCKLCSFLNAEKQESCDVCGGLNSKTMSQWW